MKRALHIIALLILSAPCLGQPVDIYYPQDADELTEAIEQAIEKAQREAENPPPIMILDGDYSFESLVENEDPDDSIISPLPLADGVRIGYAPIQALISLVTSNPSGESRALFKVEGAGVFLGALLALGIDEVDQLSPKSRANYDRALKRLAEVGEPGLTVEGFDYVVSASDSIVVISGVEADCGEQCARVERGRLVVANSRFTCDDDCIRVSEAGTDNTEFFADDLRAGFDDANLTPAQKNSFIDSVDQAEMLLASSDVAIVDSHLVSTDAAVVVTLRDFNADPTRIHIENSFLKTTSSGSRALSLDSQGLDNRVINSVITGPQSRADLVDFTYGELEIRNSFIDAGEQGLRVTDGKIRLAQTSIAMDPDALQQACDTNFSSDEIVSLGYNISPDDSCGLTATGDLENTEAGLFLDGDDAVPSFMPGAPEIDGGPFAVANNALPCGSTDMSGLPRPQQGDGDGPAECDIGPVEKQRGGAIGAPQTGAWYAPERDGEGIFLEMLANGQALIYLFSYRPDGSPFWALGVGNIDRNGIVIPKADFGTTRGPEFGENFDPAAVERIPFARLSASLPGCTDHSTAGMLAIEANDDLGFAPLLARTTSLTRIMNCDGQLLGPPFTGSYYDPTHTGEGIIVQVINENTAVIIWFTYDSQGDQYWVLGTGAIDGNTISVTGAISQTGPTYGPTFDPDDVNQGTWGDFSVTISSDCRVADFTYNSVLAEFGSGTQDMTRLTVVDGVNCGP